VADKKTAKYPHKWPDGTYHSIPWEQTKRAAAGAKVIVPEGSYDPNLDAELGKSDRGLVDLLNQIGGGTDGDPLGIQQVRSQTDLAVALAQNQQTRERGAQDYGTGQANIGTGYQRNLSDLLQARARGEQDYGTNVAGLQRNYRQLGDAQGEAQRKAGAMVGSGAALQSARKRTANEAIDRAPIDTAYQRFVADSQTGEGRLGQDRDSALAALKLAYDRGGEDLSASDLNVGRSFDRQGQDWASQLERAKREALEFGTDTQRAKIAQFTQNYPGQKLEIQYPSMPVPPAATGATITVGKGLPGTVTRRKKNKLGQMIETYTNKPAYGP
jgi:hypothetical protein